MKQINFRIIELPTHQVMLMKDWDNDDEAPTLCVTFFIDGLKVQQTYGYEQEEKRDQIFNEFSDEQAQKIVNSTVEMFTDES